MTPRSRKLGVEESPDCWKQGARR